MNSCDAVIDVNLKGVFNCTQLIVPHMLEAGQQAGMYGSAAQTAQGQQQSLYGNANQVAQSLHILV